MATDLSHLPPTAELVRDLKLQVHPEGGYFAETDRQAHSVPSPFAGGAPRPLATTIYYLLSADRPTGFVHMNRSATMHLQHTGRAEYTLVHVHPGRPPRVERVVVGPDASRGEVRQLLVGSGVWKMSRMLEADLALGDVERVGCLISEVVFPGFHWEDHQYLKKAELEEIFRGVEGGERWVRELSPFVKE